MIGAIKIILLSFHFFSLSDAYCRAVAENTDMKLKNDLLCYYDNQKRPNLELTPINLKYVLRNFEYDEHSSVLTLQARILQQWNDSRLTWKPEEYDGLTSTLVTSEYLWTPSLFLSDSHVDYGLASCKPTFCYVKNTGEIVCMFPCHQTAKCRGNFADWPFDSQNCSVPFQTYLTRTDARFEPNLLTGTVLGEGSNKWKIVKGDMKTSGEYKKVKFTFIIQRRYESFFKHVLAPGYCIIAFTLSLLWISKEGPMRSILCGFGIYLHFSLMDRTWWSIPTNATEVPRLMKYMTMMLSLAGVVLAETIILKQISTLKPPNWVKDLSKRMKSHKVAQYLVASPLDKSVASSAGHEAFVNEGEVVEPVEEDWTVFCRLIDRTLFLVLVLGYLLYNGY